MKGYINYVMYIAIQQGYLTDKYRTSEFRISFNIILFGNNHFCFQIKFSKKLYGTKNDVYPSIVSITSSKGYSSLVCKIYEIFTQANFND